MGSADASPGEQPAWSVECDDCGNGEVMWVHEDLETRGFSLHRGTDRPLDVLQ